MIQILEYLIQIRDKLFDINMYLPIQVNKCMYVNKSTQIYKISKKQTIHLKNRMKNLMITIL